MNVKETIEIINAINTDQNGCFFLIDEMIIISPKSKLITPSAIMLFLTNESFQAIS